VAFLSQDANLYEDILLGRDLHCMSASFMYDIPYEQVFREVKVNKNPEYIEMRKSAKSPTFQLQYGAGYKSIARKCGLPEALAKQFVENYYNRYSGLRQWQEDNIETVKKSRVGTNMRTENGYPKGQGELVSITGRRYVFMETESPEWMHKRGEYTSFNPPNIKNYPSQGFATGDIVPMVLGELYHVLTDNERLRDKALLINTIHDSVMLDVHESVLTEAAKTVKATLEHAPAYLEHHFAIHFDLPLRVEVEAGYNWGEMEEIVL